MLSKHFIQKKHLHQSLKLKKAQHMAGTVIIKVAFIGAGID